jgi:hypothetical protein
MRALGKGDARMGRCGMRLSGVEVLEGILRFRARQGQLGVAEEPGFWRDDGESESFFRHQLTVDVQVSVHHPGHGKPFGHMSTPGVPHVAGPFPVAE